MLIGIWTNIEELEKSLNLPELEAILLAARNKEKERNKFAAALKGINLDDEGGEQNNAKDRVEEMKRRIAQKVAGKTDAEVEYDEISDFGIDIETD